MKHSKFILILISIFIILTNCTEDYDLRFGDGEGSIIIDGLITNEPGPYYVRVTKGSRTMNFPGIQPNYYTSAKAVKDAVVIISDSGGEVDTLVAPPDSIERYYPVFDSANNVIDSVFWYNESFAKSSEFGFYRTTKIQGKPGKSYHLSVEYLNQNYEAECFMPPLPEIDSIKLKEIIVKEADGTTGWVPILYYSDPVEEKNYYMFDIGTNGYGWWTLSILDDKFLDPFVRGINIDDGFHPDWWRVNYFYGGLYGPMTVSMLSLTREGYEYYKGLISQFNNDGGVFSPAPSSPKSNFSNGALGFFQASAIRKITGYIPKV